ncbi:MAG: hypothetical protein LH474_13080 [Chamaesiphon sp.]|nr:hypothetical protein [Chamaesiphon sp.]
MKSFSIRLIGLYSLAVAGAIVFFQLVTSYGEANLKPPIPVAGSYLIAGQKLPGCLQHKALLLELHQSGIYLNTNLIVIDELKELDMLEAIDRLGKATTTDIRPTFSGKLYTSTLPNQLDLIGLIPTKTCPSPSQLRVTGVIASTDAPIYYRTPQLKGKLWLTSQGFTQAFPVEFTGVIQKKTSSLIQSH